MSRPAPSPYDRRQNLTAARPALSVVIPCYNEEDCIDLLHARVSAAARAAVGDDHEIVLINDGSKDDSAAKIRAAGAHLVNHPVNLGQGAAIQTGVEYARAQPRAKNFVTFDADGQHRVVDAAAMVARLRAEPHDVLIGSRFLDRRTQLSPLKRAVLRAGVTYTNATTGVRMTDAHNGLRVLHRDVASRLQITQNRMAHASEIVAQIGAMRIGGHRVAYAEAARALRRAVELTPDPAVRERRMMELLQVGVPVGEFVAQIGLARRVRDETENPEVRAAVHAMMNWWLDRGVNGFRMDVINLISKAVVEEPPGLLDGAVGGNGDGALLGRGPKGRPPLGWIDVDIEDGGRSRRQLDLITSVVNRT